MLRTATRDIDLGSTLDVLRALGELAKIDADREFRHLHWLARAEEETVEGWYIVSVASEAGVVATRYRDQLSAPTRELLATLARCATDAELAVSDALEATARALEVQKRKSIKERDLELVFKAAMERETRLSEVGTQHSVKLATWPRVGPVDLAAVGTEGKVACELKWWGESATGRYQTLWDLTKLGSLLAQDTFQLAFLISGAAQASWRLNDEHIRLFGDARHEVAPLCTTATNWWVSPLHSETIVPAFIETTSTARASFELEGIAFELRAARVVACEGSWQVHARGRSTP